MRLHRRRLQRMHVFGRMLDALLLRASRLFVCFARCRVRPQGACVTDAHVGNQACAPEHLTEVGGACAV
jgi:hypothetical protein